MSSIYLDSVAKPAEPRPTGGGARGTVSGIDSVEVAVDALEYLRDLAERASEHVDKADDSLTDTSEDHVGARVQILCAGNIVEDIRQALDRYLELAGS